MDSSLEAEFKSIYGIDLSDYYIDKSSYNPLVYIHKKYLPKTTAQPYAEERTIDQNVNDKCQQFDYDRLHTETYRTKVVTSEYNDPLVDQTIKFAKDIIPITIPPSTDVNNPCYYTVKPLKKTKRKHEPQEYPSNLKHPIDATYYDKEKSKLTLNIKQRTCNKNKDSISATSATQSSENNTLDDINENQLSCSLSELSEKKPKKEVFVERNQKDNIPNKMLVASESFEAIASEYMNTSAVAESKIKIHLMNEKDKQLFCENIRSPVLKAIKECFYELNNQNEVTTEIQNVNKTIRCHAKKLDDILEKLVSIENKLDLLAKHKESPKIEVIKASKLEDIGDFKEDSSEEELACVNFSSKSRGKNTPVTPMYIEKDAERDYQSVDDLARGEHVPEYFKPSKSQLGIKPERSNRIPARFCWTDTAMK